MGSRKGVPHRYSGNVWAARGRVRYGLTQWQLAMLLCVSRQRLSTYERGDAFLDGFQAIVYKALINAEGEAFEKIRAAVTSWAETQKNFSLTIYRILDAVHGSTEPPRRLLPALKI